MRRLLLIALLMVCSLSGRGQLPLRMNSDSQSSSTSSSRQGGSRRSSSGDRDSWSRDTTEKDDGFIVPIGVTQWTVDERLGSIIPAENNDTVVYNFQCFNETSGYNGEYNILGNLGSPRLSRIFLHRDASNPQLFLQPFDFLIGGLRDFRFSNTLSPMTNLAYHKVGNRTNGQERVHAYFATNINKEAGIGMKFDYLYGRGYYNNQANSQFGGNIFGYYLGDCYNIHTYINLNHLKMAENGGIENDLYITRPEEYKNLRSKDIPTLLSETWNRNKNQDFFLTHRYNMGFEQEIEIPDSLQPKMPGERELLSRLPDSLRQVVSADSLRRTLVLDSLQQQWLAELPVYKEFIPVASIIHTMRLNNLQHTYYSHATPENYYTNLYYGDLSNVKDRTRGLSIKNTVGLALREGFKKWVQMGMTAFASHEFTALTMPWLDADSVGRRRYIEQNLFVGGEISRQQSDFLHYNVTGEFAVVGDDVGDFSVDGNIEAAIPFSRRDTLQIDVQGTISDKQPNPLLEHYHSQFLWWDTELSKEFRAGVSGTLSLPRIGTAIEVGFQNLKNYTYLAMQNTFQGEDITQALPEQFSHDVAVRQVSGHIQVFSVTLRQNVKAGPFHWDNDITYQTSSNSLALPLPKISLYSNLYLQFRIAKVLNVQLGGDLRYFTRYYAPDYSPAIQQFAIQDAQYPRVKIGNYPIVNVYANLHIKHCRIYVAMNHVNAGSGNMFWAPHYPMDPRTFHFGVSWNFFN